MGSQLKETARMAILRRRLGAFSRARRRLGGIGELRLPQSQFFLLTLLLREERKSMSKSMSKIWSRLSAALRATPLHHN